MASMLGMGLPPLTHENILESACRLLDKHLSEDDQYLDLSQMLDVNDHTHVTVSGVHDFDYPNMIEAGMSPDSLAEFVSTKWTPLPPLVVQEFGRMQCTFLMGLFPQIRRAWLTIDCDIFVWKYEDGSDLAYFDELQETILCTALVKPTPGILDPVIEYLLVLATPVNIILLGVSFIKSSDGSVTGNCDEEMHLLPSPLFVVSTDNTYFTFICGTDTGRIFMAGKDGCLYELVYQTTKSWFGSQCKKINHSTRMFSLFVSSIFNFSFSEDDALVQISVDSSRNILYTRSEKGTLFVYDLGADGQDLIKVSVLPSHSVLNTASKLVSSVDQSHFGSIVHISALTKKDSMNIHLVAITTTGVRFYFTTSPLNTAVRQPCLLNLVHVRLPPGFSSPSILSRPIQNVHMSYYKKGSLLLVASRGEDNDLLWGVGQDSFPFRKQLMEIQNVLPVDGKTKAVFEDPSLTTTLSERWRGRGDQRPDPPAVLTQHIDPPRKFVVLTSEGCSIITKRRPSEQLHRLLMDCEGPESAEVKAFFRLHKPDQACATCLVLACSRPPHPKVGDWARVAFFLYGGEARYNYSIVSGGAHLPHPNIEPGSYSPAVLNTSQNNTVMFAPNTHNTSFGPMSTPMSGMQPTHMSTPAPGMIPGYSQPMYPTGVASLPGYIQEVSFSGKHDGICIYLSRILSPFWNSRVCSEFENQMTQVTYLGSAFSAEELNVVLEFVRDLSDFMDFNSRFESGEPVDSEMSGLQFQPRMMGRMDENTKQRLHAEAQKIEKISLQHIKELMQRVEEILGLWKILADHQFHAIVETLTKEQQNQLRTISFKHLVVNGKEICSSLISSLVKRYLDNSTPTEAISTKLRQTCPSLYSYNDAVFSKSNELLHAAQFSSDEEKKEKLQEALKLLTEVTAPMHLPSICKQFVDVGFFEGIVELTLEVAKRCDPYNLALHYYQKGEPPDDMQGMQMFLQRKDCYSCYTNTLAYLWSVSSHNQQVAKQPGLAPAPAPDHTGLTADEAEEQKNKMLDLGLKSDDPLFHSALYDWLFATSKLQKILELETPYIEAYLKRKALMKADNVDVLDMLWKHYEKIENFPAAAKILSSLADRYGLDVPLDKRVEYLSRAIVCARCTTSGISSNTDGEFLHELEEKMEVAQLQLQVRQAMMKMSRTHDIDEALSRLNSELVDIMTLYEEFADKFDLPACQLAIVHCAGLCDSSLIEKLWKAIIDKEICSVAKSSPQTQLTILSDRLVDVAKQYANNERYFPVPFIVKYLEQRSCVLDFDPNWVFQVLLEVGVHAEQLLEIYDRMFKSKDPNWQLLRKPLHLLTVLHGFLSHVAEEPKLITQRRKFAMRCLDAVSSYLVELQAMSATNHNVKKLVQCYKELQAKLEHVGSDVY